MFSSPDWSESVSDPVAEVSEEEESVELILLVSRGQHHTDGADHTPVRQLHLDSRGVRSGDEGVVEHERHPVQPGELPEFQALAAEHQPGP